MNTLAECANCGAKSETVSFCADCGFDYIQNRQDDDLKESFLKDWLRDEKMFVKRVAMVVLVEEARNNPSWRERYKNSMRLDDITVQDIEQALEQSDSLDFRSDFERAMEQLYRGELENAATFLRSGAEAGDPKAQNTLGSALLDGEDWGLQVDPLQALEWIEKAANQSYLPAQFQLGQLYETGTAVTQNSKTAVEWFRKSATKGFPYAECKLAEICAEEFDIVGTFMWYERAAYRGDCVAQFNVGLMYESGIAVEPNDQFAEFWWQKAASQGFKEALEHIAASRKKRGVSEQ